MNEKLLKATHAGNLNLAGLEIPCFVLEDGRRVISGRGMTKAIGMRGRGQGVSRITTHKTLIPFFDNELAVAISSPIKFMGIGSRETSGYEATILHDLCQAVLNARDSGALKTDQEKRYGRFADMLIRSFARVGIIALVDEATGYQEFRDRIALQAILDKYLRKELAAWAKRFPDEFYKQIFRLRGWQWRGMSINRPSVVGKITRDIVYERLAPGILEKLQKLNPKDIKGQRPVKFHQWLSDEYGLPALAQHLYAVINLMRVASSWRKFQDLLNRALPKKGQNLLLPLDYDEINGDYKK